MKTSAHIARRVTVLFAAVIVFTALVAGCRPTYRKTGGRASRAAASLSPFRFAVYGDTRNGHAMHRKLVALMLDQNPAFVLQTGDLVASGRDDALWATYDEITAPLRAKVTIYPAHGNHDMGGTGYKQRVPASIKSVSKLYYSFDFQGCHFVSLDTESPYNRGTPQFTWMEDDLKAAKNARHIFVFLHEAPYSVGPHGDTIGIQKAWCPLFRQYRVAAVFCGHDHLYYRTIRDGIPYVVTGGGGAPLYDITNRQNGIPGDVAEKTNNIVVCDVDGFKVTFRALRSDGSTLDEFTLPVAS
jgi:predicted phosphodiesterase